MSMSTVKCLREHFLWCYRCYWMDKGKKKDPHAMAMVRQRLKKLSPERRQEIARKAAAARWKGNTKPAPAKAE